MSNEGFGLSESQNEIMNLLLKIGSSRDVESAKKIVAKHKSNCIDVRVMNATMSKAHDSATSLDLLLWFQNNYKHVRPNNATLNVLIHRSLELEQALSAVEFFKTNFSEISLDEKGLHGIINLARTLSECKGLITELQIQYPAITEDVLVLNVLLDKSKSFKESVEAIDWFRNNSLKELRFNMSTVNLLLGRATTKEEATMVLALSGNNFSLQKVAKNITSVCILLRTAISRGGNKDINFAQSVLSELEEGALSKYMGDERFSALYLKYLFLSGEQQKAISLIKDYIKKESNVSERFYLVLACLALNFLPENHNLVQLLKISFNDKPELLQSAVNSRGNFDDFFDKQVDSYGHLTSDKFGGGNVMADEITIYRPIDGNALSILKRPRG